MAASFCGIHVVRNMSILAAAAFVSHTFRITGYLYTTFFAYPKIYRQMPGFVLCIISKRLTASNLN
jgi:hypothetical protein